MRGRAARWVRWLGMATAIAVPTGATAFLVAGPASATDPTVQVTFTAKGVDQQNLTIKPGTDVVFANDVDPSQGVPILGTVTGLVRSVSITVTGRRRSRSSCSATRRRPFRRTPPAASRSSSTTRPPTRPPICC